MRLTRCHPLQTRSRTSLLRLPRILCARQSGVTRGAIAPARTLAVGARRRCRDHAALVVVRVDRAVRRVDQLARLRRVRRVRAALDDVEYVSSPGIARSVQHLPARCAAPSGSSSPGSRPRTCRSSTGQSQTGNTAQQHDRPAYLTATRPILCGRPERRPYGALHEPYQRATRRRQHMHCAPRTAHAPCP